MIKPEKLKDLKFNVHKLNKFLRPIEKPLLFDVFLSFSRLFKIVSVLAEF